MTWHVAEIRLQVHDDDLEDVIKSMPDHAYQLANSSWGLYWNQVVITDPMWITWYNLRDA